MLLRCGTRSPLYLIGDAASRRGLSRVGYFITLDGPLNGHPPSYDYVNKIQAIEVVVLNAKAIPLYVDNYIKVFVYQ